MSELPPGWISARLGEIIDGIQAGKNIRCIERPPEGNERGIIKISAVTWGQFREDESKTVPVGTQLDERTRIFPGDLLISRANTADLLGAAVRVNAISRRLYLSDKVLRINARADVVPWVHRALNSPDLRQAMSDASSGNQLSMRNISQESLKSLVIPIPPLGEQSRVVRKLEDILDRLERCRDRLRRVPPILKRFREAVLEAAVSGWLTEEWRGGKESQKWQSLPLSSVCLSITDGDHQPPPQASEGIPFITISAINDGRLRLDRATRYVPKRYYDALKPERRPEVGDILFSVAGSFGIPALVDTPELFTFQRHIGILKPDNSRVLSRFLLYSLGARSTGIQARSVATGTAQLTIPLSGLRLFDVSIPGLSEQAEVVRRVDKLFALADSLQRRCDNALVRVKKLTPSVLAKAFRGELVPQDPGDEPATVLLERIKSERPNRTSARMEGRSDSEQMRTVPRDRS